MSDKAFIDLTGLWMNESKKGTKYMSGNLGFAKVYIFKNENKTKESQPDYFLKIAEATKPEAKTQEATTENPF